MCYIYDGLLTILKPLVDSQTAAKCVLYRRRIRP